MTKKLANKRRLAKTHSLICWWICTHALVYWWSYLNKLSRGRLSWPLVYMVLVSKCFELCIYNISITVDKKVFLKISQKSPESLSQALFREIFKIFKNTLFIEQIWWLLLLIWTRCKRFVTENINYFTAEVPIIQKPVHWFADQISGVVFIWFGSPSWLSSLDN